MSERRNTSVPFSREETRLIRDMMATPRGQLACPHCGETLLLVGPITAEGTTGPTCEVTCWPCRRSAIITDVPGIPRPEV